MKSYKKLTSEIDPVKLQTVKAKKNDRAIWHEEIKIFFINFELNARMLKCSFAENYI